MVYALEAVRHPYLLILTVALALRLLFLCLMLGHFESPSALTTLATDSDYYWTSSESLLTEHSLATRGVQIFGPGYPVFLAALRFLTGENPIWVLVVQILLSSLSAVLLAELAYRLTADRAVAVLAGLLLATSVTSVSLANALLSDCLFIFLALCGLLVLVRACRMGSFVQAILAGLLIAFATLTRSAGLVLVVLMPLVGLLVSPPIHETTRGGRRSRVRLAAVSCLVTLSVLGAWVSYNYVRFGVPLIAQAGSIAQMRMTALFAEEAEGIPFDTTLARLQDSVLAQTSNAQNTLPAFSQVASRVFWRQVRSYPAQSAASYFRNVDQSVHTDLGILQLQFPKWWLPISDFFHWIDSWLMRHRIALLSVVGLGLLLGSRRWALASVLVGIYVGFALLAGMTRWQGTRVFHPGILAWSILVSIALKASYQWVKRALGSRPATTAGVSA